MTVRKSSTDARCEQDNARDIITLREYFDAKLDARREVIDMRLDRSDDALKIQAAEMGRRLDLLNHEQARLASDRERYMPRETYAANQEEYMRWRSTIDIALASTTGRGQGIATAVAVVVAVVMAAIALVNALK